MESDTATVEAGFYSPRDVTGGSKFFSPAPRTVVFLSSNKTEKILQEHFTQTV